MIKVSVEYVSPEGLVVSLLESPTSWVVQYAADAIVEDLLDAADECDDAIVADFLRQEVERARQLMRKAIGGPL